MDKASLKSRILAYIIDIALIFLIIYVISLIMPNREVINLKQSIRDTEELFLSKKISFPIFFDQMAINFYNLDKSRIMYSLINCILIFIYFIFIPYFFDGKTLGKKILKIKTIRNDKECLSLRNLVIKNLVDTGLLYALISLSMLYILKEKGYFIIAIIFSIIQLFLVIASICMIIKRKDKRGLNDILSGTKVINEVKE